MSEILRPEFPLGSVTYRHVRDGIFIRQDDYYRKCLYTDLLWVEASGSYSDIHLRDRSRIVVALRIGVMGRYLPASHFVRIHRSYVVSLFDIDTFVGNMLRIGDKWFPIGRLYWHFSGLLQVYFRCSPALSPIYPCIYLRYNSHWERR